MLELINLEKVAQQKKVHNFEISESGEIYAVFIGQSGDDLELNLNFIHKLPQLESQIIIKAVLFDDSQFELTGNLVIEQGARKVDTYLKIEVLMMSNNAKATAVPALEIMETDVKGGHGATVGQVDAEQLFYLQSRGLSKKDAEQVIVSGFLQDVWYKLEQTDHQTNLHDYFATKSDNFLFLPN